MDQTRPRRPRPAGSELALPAVAAVAAVVVLAVAVLDLRPAPPAAAVLGTLLLAVALGAGIGTRRAADAHADSLALVRAEQTWLCNLVRAASDEVLVLADDLTVRWAADRLTGLVGTRVTDALHPDDAAVLEAWLTDPTQPVTGLRTLRLTTDDEGCRLVEAAVTDLRTDAAGRALVLHLRDVSARTAADDELRSLAFTDRVTGLPNRAAHLRALADELSVAGAEPGTALLLFEVEGLDEARENLGRDVVDVALVEVGRRLRATVRAEDQVARVGGELFTVLAHGADGDTDRVARRCLAVVEQPITTELGLVDLSAGVGVVPLVAGLTVPGVIDAAELAVAAATAAGPGSVRRWEPALAAARDRREQLRQDLVGARARGELTLVWQPVVSLAEQRVVGVEALVRWQHPCFGELEPEEFIPIAERAGLVGDLQRWVFAEATAAVVTLPQHGPTPLRLGVNVSAHHVASGTLVGDVSAALRTSGLAPERLVVEITECTVLAGGGHTETDFSALRLMGVHVALDDFGSGWSSLAHLTRLPVDVVKLDRSFLARVDRDPQTRALCASVIGIGGALGLDVVAEGVETPSQLAVLASLGCGFAQGFLLSRPLPLAGLVQLLDASSGQLWPGRIGSTDAVDPVRS